MLLAKGQVEGLGTSPHLMLRAGSGAALEDRLVPNEEAHAPRSGHAAHPRRAEDAFCGDVCRGSWTSRGAWRAGLLRTARAAPRHYRGASAVHPAGAAASAAQSVRHRCRAACLPRGDPQVACFDTAFHRAHSWVNDAFAPATAASMRRACAATASTGCPTSTFRRGCGEVAPEAAKRDAWSSRISATARRCARSRTAGAWLRPWASRRSTACPWARAAASSIPPWCSTS